MKGKKVDTAKIEAALRPFLAVEGHLVLGFEKEGEGVYHRLFQKSLERLSLFAPRFDVNGVLYLRRLFSKAAKLIVMLRPCEIRAYVELAKLTQVERESIIAVSVDCFGTISTKEHQEALPKEATELKAFFDASKKKRWACSVCREPRGVVGDAGIRLDKAGALWAFAYTSRGEEFLSLIEGDLETPGGDMTLPATDKAEVFQSDLASFSKDFEKCIMCMNCRDMCPVCYCLDCVFKGDDYLPKGDALLNKVFRSGSATLPQGKELFHFVRMYHVSQTCVACGACEEACPQGIPLTKYMKGTSERLQALFSYMSGRSFDETVPYLTFQEDELKDAED